MNIKTEVSQYIVDNFLPDVPLESIDESMPLITGGVIDSIGMIGLVAFLESRYDVEFMPREIDVHSLDTVLRIVELMHKKLANRKIDLAAGETKQVL